MGRYPYIEPPRYYGVGGNAAFTAPWITFPGSRAPLFYRDAEGLIHLEGLILNSNGAVAVNDQVSGAMPAGYAPSSTLFLPGNGIYLTNAGALFSNQAGAAGALVFNLSFVYRPV